MNNFLWSKFHVELIHIEDEIINSISINFFPLIYQIGFPMVMDKFHMNRLIMVDAIWNRTAVIDKSVGSISMLGAVNF